MSYNTILATTPLTSTGYHLKATGTTIGNSLIWDNGTNVGIGNTNTSYTLDVSGTGRFTGMITSTVGNNAKIFDSASATTGYQYFQMSNSVGTMVLGVDNNAGTGLAINSLANAVVLNNSANAPLILGTNNTNRMTITSAGNVGIGTSSPAGKLAVLAGTYQHLIYKAESTYQSSLRFNEENNGARFYTDAGTEEFRMQQQYASTGFLTFYTGTTERMRITSGGDVFVGFSGSAPGQRLRTQGADSGNVNYSLVVANSTTASTFLVRNDGLIQTGTQSGSPYNNTSGAAANLVVNSAGTLERSTSSLKYKKDVKDYNKGLAEVLAMRPVYYKGISESDGDKQFAGLIAEEIDALGLNEFVTYAEDGSPDALAYQNMIALLTKAIQEQQAQIEELKALINK